MSWKIISVCLILLSCVALSSAGGYKIPTFDRDFRIASCRTRCLQNEEKTITITSLEHCMEYSTCWQCWDFCRQLEVNRLKFHVVCNNPFYCYSGCRLACSYYLEEGNMKSEPNTPRHSLLISQWEAELECQLPHVLLWTEPVVVYTFYYKRRGIWIMDHQAPNCTVNLWTNERVDMIITATSRTSQLAATPFIYGATNGTVRRNAAPHNMSPISRRRPHVLRELGRIGPKRKRMPEVENKEDSPSLSEMKAMLNYSWCASVISVTPSADSSQYVNVNITWNPYPMVGIYNIVWRKKNETHSMVMHLSNNRTALLPLPVGNLVLVKVQFDNIQQSIHLQSSELEVDTTRMMLVGATGDYFVIRSVYVYACGAALAASAAVMLYCAWRNCRPKSKQWTE